jgi:Spy/CpxP family protein refolding chaperone
MVQKIKAHAQTRKQIHDILTPEQQKKAEEMHEKRMERYKERHGSDQHGSDRWG